MIYYHRQNIIQKKVMNIIRFIKPVKTRYSFETYTPKLNKVRVGFGSIGVIACLLTPCTNWLIPFIVRFSLK